MSEKKNDLDKLLEGVNSGKFDATPMSEFDKLAKEVSVDDLSRISRDAGQQEAPKVGEAKENPETRYQYFMQSLDEVSYNQRLSPSYRTGFEMALDRYIGKADLNKTNLSIVDRMIAQEILACGHNGTGIFEGGLKAPIERRGYYDGLKTVQELLDRSKAAMMRKTAAKVLAALGKE